MLPKFAKHQLIWIAVGLIILLYFIAPTSGLVNVLRQIFHVVFTQALAWFG